MQLYISKDSRPEDVTRFFTYCYPFLKIELYQLGKSTNGSSKKPKPIVDKFSDLRAEGFVDIDSEITVGQLIERFATFGLKTEIFRKFGNVWIETMLTDNWTLQQQNKAGEEITSQVQ